MDSKLVKALNQQLNSEFYSSYLYLAMAAYFDASNLPGFGSWMKIQAKEEMSHAMKLFEFLNNVGQKAVLEAIVKPPANFSSPQDVFKKTLAHEKGVTASINKLYELAVRVKDNATAIMLQWYITEQVEEEKSATAILEDLKVVKPDSVALIMLDRALAKRGG